MSANIRIRLVKDWNGMVAGHETEMLPSRANQLVARGFAEVIKAKKKATRKKKAKPNDDATDVSSADTDNDPTVDVSGSEETS